MKQNSETVRGRKFEKSGENSTLCLKHRFWGVSAGSWFRHREA